MPGTGNSVCGTDSFAPPVQAPGHSSSLDPAANRPAIARSSLSRASPLTVGCAEFLSLLDPVMATIVPDRHPGSDAISGHARTHGLAEHLVDVQERLASL